MDDKRRELLEALGYREPVKTAAPTVAPPEAGRLAMSTRLDAPPPEPPALEGDAELPLLSAEELDALRAAFMEEPENVLGEAAVGLGTRVTVSAFVDALQEVDLWLRSPEQGLHRLKAETLRVKTATMLPPDFTFPQRTAEIPIHPERTRFEPLADLRGWLMFCGSAWLKRGTVVRAPFRWHFAARSRYRYALREPSPDHPVEVALFSDFGTGEYPSLYIARQLKLRGERLEHAIHLGGVFYAGRQGEFDAHVAEPLSPLYETTSLLTLNAGPEMRSGGGSYFRSLDERRGLGAKQVQEGSYFCLASERFQLIGIDTAYFEPGRYQEPALCQWLEQVLSEGRRRGAVNILLSQGAPYRHDEARMAPLLTEDLKEVLARGWVDMWCWGGTHCGALFDRTPELPFIGLSLGHGGFPYARQVLESPSRLPIRFFESRARFPEWTGVRQDRGNHGYCTLLLNADGSLGLRFMDWMGELRCIARLVREGGRGPLGLHRVESED
ncbi:hypothetical protein JGU66_35505 [Myxococcaceae bacterium JPH2]|nr:hypothetical protein [Myxococcaceae bacterium JPH2]